MRRTTHAVWCSDGLENNVFPYNGQLTSSALVAHRSDSHLGQVISHRDIIVVYEDLIHQELANPDANRSNSIHHRCLRSTAKHGLPRLLWQAPARSEGRTDELAPAFGVHDCWN
ncbi:hypothetical protein AcW2_004350 [Taiwanofungus camphoratus]|nr:hypothetical protein AcW2_004350 [Antrodia cinnamomea]